MTGTLINAGTVLLVEPEYRMRDPDESIARL